MKKNEYSFGSRISINACGSGGEVLKCRRISDGIEFAVKRISKLLSRENHSQILVLQHLDHRNIIKLIDWFEDADKLYIVMELAGGGDLCDRIMQQGRMAEKNAVLAFAQILSAIGYMHSCNIMHCDIKPDNILYMSHDRVEIKVCDFGYAQPIKHSCQTLKHHGTMAYSAPEVIDGRPFDAKADMWSLGVLLYTMLAGFAPFGQRRSAVQTDRIRKGELNFNHEVFHDVSPDAMDLIRRLVVVAPQQRLSAEEALRHRWIVNNANVEEGLFDRVGENWRR